MKDSLFSVGFHKGEMDFCVSCAVYELSYEEMRCLREMIVVGIGVCEQMWRDAQDKKNPPQQELKGSPSQGSGGGE